MKLTTVVRDTLHFTSGYFSISLVWLIAGGLRMLRLPTTRVNAMRDFEFVMGLGLLRVGFYNPERIQNGFIRFGVQFISIISSDEIQLEVGVLIVDKVRGLD